MSRLSIYKVLAVGLTCSSIITSINYPVYAEEKSTVCLENEINDQDITETEQTIEQLVEEESYFDLEEDSQTEIIQEKESESIDETQILEDSETDLFSEFTEDNKFETDFTFEENSKSEEFTEFEEVLKTETDMDVESTMDESAEMEDLNGNNLDAIKESFASAYVISGNYGENLGSNVKYTLTGNETDGYTLSLTGEGKMFSIFGITYVSKLCPWQSYKKYIKHISIDEGITNIGAFAFYHCSYIEGDIKIPSTVTEIEKSAYLGCTRLTGILEIPDGVTKIGSNAFYGCEKLTGVKLPSTIEYIGETAFRYCSGLVGKVEIPSSVTYLAEDAFATCPGLKRIVNNSEYSLTLPSSSDTWWIKLGDTEGTHIDTIANGTAIRMPMEIIVDGIIYKVISNASSSVNGTAELIDGTGYFSSNLTIPSVIADEDGNSYDVITIADEAFKNCADITGTITLPSTLKTIGDSAFWGCTGLMGDLVIPNGVTTIGEDAFWDCENLNGTLTLPNSLTSLGDAAFESCEKLSGTLSIPVGLNIIPDNAFAFDSGFSGTLEIPENITSIGASAFEECTGITDIIIKSTFGEVNDYAFNRCFSLNRVYISSGVNSIGEQVFYDTEKESNLTIIVYADESSYAYKWAVDNGFYCVSTNFWNEPIYKISFDSNGGNEITSYKLVVNNNIYGSLPQITKTNYDFLGWYTFDGNEIKQDSIVNLSEDQILYAKWQEIKGFEFTEEVKDSRLGNTCGSINISLKKMSYTYTGSEIQPAPTVNYIYQEYDSNRNLGKFKKQKLVQNVDYTISYENNINVSGEHKIIIKGIGDFYGEITKTFTIEPKLAKNLTIEPIADWGGTFEEISNKIEDIVIIRDGIFTVEPSNYDVNISKGTSAKGEAYATVTIAVKENYTGDASKAKTTFNIVDKNKKIDASNLVLTVKSNSLTYTGKALKPKVNVTDATGNKVSSKNYKLIYKNNINAGKGTVYAVGKNDYYGTSNSISFIINPRNFSKVKITKLAKIMFRSSVDDIHPIIKDGNTVLKEGIDYRVTFETSNGLSLFGMKSKKITVTIENLSSNYTSGTKTSSLIITPRNIKSTMMCVITVDKEQAEDKTKPSVTVKYAGKVLTEGEDYTLKYSGDTIKGSIKITGVGNYIGTRTIKF